MPTLAETAGLLRGLEIFQSLPPEDLSRLAEVAVPRRWEAGEIVFREGDAGDTCYVIQAGSVKVTRRHSDGRVISLAELRPGQMFGELAMFGGETRSATVEAIEATDAVALLVGDVRRVVVARPETAWRMLAALADRLRSANERIARQSFQTVPARVAQALLAQVEAAAPAARDGGLVEPARDVLVRITQADLAQLAGTSRESASRFLATLERAGVLTTGRGKVTVHDPPALGRYVY